MQSYVATVLRNINSIQFNSDIPIHLPMRQVTTLLYQTGGSWHTLQVLGYKR